MAKLDIKAMLLKRIDLRGLLVEDLLEGFVESALEELVNKSGTPFDNIAKDALYPPLHDALVKAIDAMLKKLEGSGAIIADTEAPAPTPIEGESQTGKA